MFCQPTDHVGIATRLVIGPRIALFLWRILFRETLHRGHAHFTTIEEIPAGEVVTAGKFLVNNHPVVVLFDSGASHSFISPSYASKFG
jgi:hypothetical protein